MTPADFVNFARQKRGCNIVSRGMNNAIVLEGPKGGRWFVNPQYRYVNFVWATKGCIRLGVDLITQQEFDSY